LEKYLRKKRSVNYAIFEHVLFSKEVIHVGTRFSRTQATNVSNTPVAKNELCEIGTTTNDEPTYPKFALPKIPVALPIV
jgi:hypothetical protein